MVTTYKEALDWIHGRLRLGIKPGLKRMEAMMSELGSPETKLKAVHIGGTNGKGSTVTFLRSILEASGYSVGTFTSPYIEQFNERISVNGQAISDGEIVELVNVIHPLAHKLEETELGGPTEFEVITAMAFYYFGHVHPVDIVLFEVGLGGRLDSTNIIQPMASVITNIGLDHTNILGNTYEEIAFEKAGIIKENTPVFTAVQHKGSLQVIKNQASEKNASILVLNEDFSIVKYQGLTKGEQFSLKSKFGDLTDLELGMIGKHQTENASLAVVALQYLDEQKLITVTEQSIRTGLSAAYWPGRFEVLSEQPLVILDGAHNDEGVSKLVETLSTRYANRSIHIVFAALKDKKLDKMIAQLDQVADQITFVSFDFPRAAAAEALVKLSHSEHKLGVEDWRTYLSEEVARLKEEEVLVITGSLYFISEVKSYLRITSQSSKILLKQ
ncbi:bifunctional folylpolyglutamate synthase/dihydrofolate synthase [Mesobacillus maritimus]|uniref:tetrahydrofolate synthase n=1 Tax=Mesobacillus maritimus TaxID=1643336 RepID=A0ABS7KAH9_9BACI|nr:folylpolyglutamate synthase/dihydrofolate synthase family protein [Mesobacillus maritimus]MBY0099110.1 bifunctional folylpolyglutamate synthase/dihydrofolate synthase [Mesobacillus maritimus]